MLGILGSGRLSGAGDLSMSFCLKKASWKLRTWSFAFAFVHFHLSLMTQDILHILATATQVGHYSTACLSSMILLM